MLEIYDADRLAKAGPNDIGDVLEQGNIVKFAPCPIELPSTEDLQSLRETLPQQLKRKNVSYHPEADRVDRSRREVPRSEIWPIARSASIASESPDF